MSALVRASLLLLFLLPLVLAATPAERISSAQFYIDDSQSVSVSGGQLTDLRINFSIPIDSTVVLSPPAALRQTDEQGNSYLQIYQSNPILPFDYEIKTTLSTQAQHVDSLPSQWSAPPNAAIYLQSTPKVPASDPAFARLATQITENATTPFEQLSALAQYTHDYIEYDPSMVGQGLSASQILQTRRGVCTEYSTLFITLARSLGYPSRFVNGYAYSDKYNAWLGHAWAEVYIGRWVSVDPTWLEVGNLDATHIISSRQAVQAFQSASVTALVRPSSAQLVWDGGESRGATATNVHLVSEQSSDPDGNYTLAASSGSLPPGGKFIVFMKYPATDYRVLPASLAPCRNENGPPILTLSSPEQVRLTTAAGQPSYAIWTGQAGSSLDSNVRYTCPTTLNSDYLALNSINVNITTADPISWLPFEAGLSSATLLPGANQTVFVRLPSSMAAHPVTVLEDSLLLTTQADRNGQATLSFIPLHRGPHTLYVFSDAGDPQVLTYSVGPSDALSISDVHLAHLALEGEDNQLLVTWGGATSNAAGWRLEWTWGGQSGQSNLSSTPGQVSIPFTPPSSGNNLLTLRLLLPNGQEMLRQSQPLEVFPGANVTVEPLQLQPSATPGHWNVNMQIDTSGALTSLTLLLDGQVLSVPDDGSISIDLPPGHYKGYLTWNDAAGQPRQKEFLLDASATPPAPNIARSMVPKLSVSRSTLFLLPLVLAVILGLGLVVWYFRHHHSSRPPPPPL